MHTLHFGQEIFCDVFISECCRIQFVDTMDGDDERFPAAEERKEDAYEREGEGGGSKTEGQLVLLLPFVFTAVPTLRVVNKRSCQVKCLQARGNIPIK